MRGQFPNDEWYTCPSNSLLVGIRCNSHQHPSNITGKAYITKGQLGSTQTLSRWHPRHLQFMLLRPPEEWVLDAAMFSNSRPGGRWSFAVTLRTLQRVNLYSLCSGTSCMWAWTAGSLAPDWSWEGAGLITTLSATSLLLYPHCGIFIDEAVKHLIHRLCWLDDIHEEIPCWKFNQHLSSWRAKVNSQLDQYFPNPLYGRGHGSDWIKADSPDYVANYKEIFPCQDPQEGPLPTPMFQSHQFDPPAHKIGVCNAEWHPCSLYDCQHLHKSWQRPLTAYCWVWAISLFSQMRLNWHL